MWNTYLRKSFVVQSIISQDIHAVCVCVWGGGGGGIKWNSKLATYLISNICRFLAKVKTCLQTRMFDMRKWHAFNLQKRLNYLKNLYKFYSMTTIQLGRGAIGLRTKSNELNWNFYTWKYLHFVFTNVLFVVKSIILHDIHAVTGGGGGVGGGGKNLSGL